ncbi:MAG: hypothetical protein KDD53_11430, partial [Bdellovibrionales bacterium]|nr:hypothetical protein [Bdellovibrionales bacterium]
AFMEQRFDTVMGNCMRVVVGVGDLSLARDGTVEAKYCFVMFRYTEDGHRFLTDVTTELL